MVLFSYSLKTSTQVQGECAGTTQWCCIEFWTGGWGVFTSRQSVADKRRNILFIMLTDFGRQIMLRGPLKVMCLEFMSVPLVVEKNIHKVLSM